MVFFGSLVVFLGLPHAWASGHVLSVAQDDLMALVYARKIILFIEVIFKVGGHMHGARYRLITCLHPFTAPVVKVVDVFTPCTTTQVSEEPAEEPEKPKTVTKTVVNESGAEPQEKEEEKEAPESSGVTFTTSTGASEAPRTATATVSNDGGTARGTGVLGGDGEGTVTTTVRAGGVERTATTTARRLLSVRGFIFNSNDHADSDFWQYKVSPEPVSLPALFCVLSASSACSVAGIAQHSSISTF